MHLKSLFKSTFYRKTQISLIIFILLPFALASLFSYLLIKDAVVKKVESSRQNVVNTVAGDLNKTIEEIIYASNLYDKPLSNTLNVMKEFKDVAELNSFQVYERYKQLNDFVNLAFSKVSNFNAQVFYINNSNFIISSNNYSLTQESIKESIFKLIKPEWIESLNPNKLYWLDTSKLKDTDPDAEQSYYFAVRSFEDVSNKEFLGAVFVGIPHEYFKNLFKNIEDGQISLYNEDNQIIFQRSDSEAASDEADLSVISAPVPLANWKIVQRFPSKDVTGEISDTFQFYAIFLSLSVLLFLIIIAVFISRSLYRPLNKLQKTAEMFGDENLNDKRFPVEGNDEIAVLGEAFNNMLDQINALFKKVNQEQEERRIIELDALFAQIRPHFLINTLNSIKCNLLLNDDEIHSQQIDSLMRLLRAYLKVDELTTLKQECKLLWDYTEIMKMRNDMNVELVCDLDPELEGFQIPRLILQPLVENSIIHGFPEIAEVAKIGVKAKKIAETVKIEIIDNGVGMSSEEIENIMASFENEDSESKKHIGLVNVLKRLRLTYGAGVSMVMEANEGSGVTVIISIPDLPEKAGA